MRLGCAVRVRVSGLYPLSGVYQSAAIQSLSLLHLAGVTKAWPLLSRAQGRLSKRRGSGAAMGRMDSWEGEQGYFDRAGQRRQPCGRRA